MKSPLSLLILTSLATLFAPLGAQNYRVEHLGTDINTPVSESGALLLDDSTLLYASTQMTSATEGHLYLVDFSTVNNQIMLSRRQADGSFAKGEFNRWGFNRKGYNCGNVAFDDVHNVLYFTMQENGRNTTAQIYSSRYSNGRWSKPQPLGGDVNLKGYTSTHPTIGHTRDGRTILYYSSDRPGGVGGLDIWYVFLLGNGQPGHSTNLGTPVNTDSNEVTPFYSNAEETLYFSSNRTGGMGGYDVYSAAGSRNTWKTPVNMGKELNSAYNDLYFNLVPCRCQCGGMQGEEWVEACGFLTSNRPGSLFQVDSNCCNDIYRWSRIRKPQPAKKVAPQPPAETPWDLLPLSIYFHNDQPDPATLDTNTRISYTYCWNHYMQLRDEYKGAQPSPADKRKWDSIQMSVDFFFDHDLKQGYQKLLRLCDLLNRELKTGKKVVLTLEGYASPLHASEYNVNLSKRRIMSIYNLMKEWNDEALLPYLNNGHLVLMTAAMGAPDEETVAPSDPLRNPKDAKSVYSIDAALDRRVDIIDIKVED